MVEFQPTGSARLLALPASSGPWMGIALPAAPAQVGPIALDRALTDPKLLATFVFSALVPDGWQTPGGISAKAGDDLADQVGVVIEAAFAQRAVLWAADPQVLYTGPPASPTLLATGFGLTPEGAQVSQTPLMALTQSLWLNLTSTSTVALTDDGEGLTITAPGSSNNVLALSGSSAPSQTSDVAQATLPLSGAHAASIRFPLAVIRSAFGATGLRWGFQTFVPSVDPADHGDVTGYYPLADPTVSPSDLIGFDVAIDPSDPANAIQPGRTAWAFTGTNDDGSTTTLTSWFRTTAGHGVELTPTAGSAALTFQPGSQAAPTAQRFVLGPQGDFTMHVPETETSPHDLMCGLAGTETITFVEGDALRFTADAWKDGRRAGPAAYAATYPWPETSPTSAPTDPTASLLTDRYATSYASVVSATDRATADDVNGIHYSAQPHGFSLYGQQGAGGADAAGFDSLLWAKSPGVDLVATEVFPLLPYAGTMPSDHSSTTAGMDATTMGDLESRGITPTRRAAISTVTTSSSKAATLGLLGAGAEDDLYLATTPSGLIVQVDGGDYSWALLGQNGGTDGIQMRFCHPKGALFDALQSSSLFMVAANNDDDVLGALQGWKLGETQTPPCDPDASQFFNAMAIGTGADAWAFEADVGQCNHYGDYSNVLIIKGRPGSLRDLVRNPSLWTERSTLGAPSDLPTGVACGTAAPQRADPGELVTLSGWLQDYIADAIAQADDEDNPDRAFFQKFKDIALSETWTGVLVLKATLAQVPAQLGGLLAGIDRTQFNAHHFGISISPIAGTTIEIPDTSSMFGLVYYVDPVYRVLGQAPIPPAPGATYDFRVLTLKVLFDNSTVQDFRSLAQATLNEVFDQPVTQMGDPANTYNSIVLNGSFQKQGTQTLYTLETTGDNTFYFDSNIMNKVEVVKAQFSTVSETPHDDGTTVIESRISMWGFIDFKVMEQQPASGNSVPPTGCDAPTDDPDPLLLDVLSYGNLTGEDLPRKGLSFAGLALAMTDVEPPTGSPAAPVRVLAFDPSKMTFDPQQSTPRPDSAAVQLALRVSAFSGSAQRTASSSGGGAPKPGDLGYLDVGADVRLDGVADVWNGIAFRVDMGTPGNLAGDVGLTSELLVAWSPSSAANTYVAALGIKLPGTGGGAKLLSIEGVLRVSIGRIELCRVATGASEGAYVLVLDDIALKFLGMLKLPPSGSTSFRLFGRPGSVGQLDPSALGWLAMYSQSSSGGTAVAARSEVGS